MPLDLQRLIDVVVEELSVHGPSNGARRCRCHGRPVGSCPDRGAPEAAQPEPQRGAVRGVARLIDHSLLRPDATQAEIETLCREAAEYQFAAVCVNPVWVRRCAALLQSTPVRVCSVVAFPFGATTPDAKVYEARRAIFDGALEIDMVIDIGALKSGCLQAVASDIEGVTSVCRQEGVLSKVIIETALLTLDEKVTACVLAKAGGADFVKTSTGFSAGGATVDDVALIRRIVGPDLGVKAAGGIRDLATLDAMVAAGATRIGTSAGVQIVREALASFRADRPRR